MASIDAETDRGGNQDERIASDLRLLSSLVWGLVLTCHEDGGSKFAETLVVMYQTTTNSMEQIPSCEAYRCSGIEEISLNKWSSTVHYSNHNSPPSASVLTQNSTRPCKMSRKMVRFNCEDLALHPIPKLGDHPLSAVIDCLFIIFADTVLSYLVVYLFNMLYFKMSCVYCC